MSDGSTEMAERQRFPFTVAAKSDRLFSTESSNNLESMRRLSNVFGRLAVDPNWKEGSAKAGAADLSCEVWL
jgi:hypothetical protein